MEMLTEDPVAERIAIDSYGEMVRYIGDKDPTTRHLMEGILAMEEDTPRTWRRCWSRCASG